MKELQSLSVVSPGFYGLNTQESGITLSPNFAQLTDNVVIDKYGRLGSRKGWLMKTDSGATTLSDGSIDFLMEHINAGGTSTILSGAIDKLFKNGDNGDVLVDITPASYTIDGNKWKGASLLDKALICQAGHEPIVYSEAATPAAKTLSVHTGETASFGTSYPQDVLAAYGRFWVHDGDSVYWSTDIADTAFPAFAGGTSGLLNIASVLPNNVDKIIALASHNGFLIILCEHNIVIYKGADNPLGDFSLLDVITGVGCVARDSVAYTGNDLIFLSDTGVRSLGRLIQEKSLPMRDLTKNVRDDLLADLISERGGGEGLTKVTAVYSEINAFYLLSFPSTQTIYCLDMRQPLEDGSARVTQWYSYQATSFLRTQDRRVLIGKTNGIGLYSGNTDNGAPYRLRYFSHYLDLQSPTQLKILKQIKATVIGGSNQSFVIKAGFDYSTATRSYPFTLADRGVSEYGIAEYNIGEFSFGINLDSVKSSVGGSGNVIQIGFEANVNGNELSVQKLDIFVKTGRIS
jgi:hypothetical protein